MLGFRAMSGLWEKIRERIAPLLAVVERYGSDHGARLAASLAYRAVFALAPLLLVAVSVAGFVYGTADAQARLVAEIQPFVGAEASALVFDLLEQAADSRNSTGVIGLLLMTWTASALFLEAQGSLNLIFGSDVTPEGGIGAWFIRRGLALATALSMGLVLLAVIGSGAAWRIVESRVGFPDELSTVFGWVTPLVAWLVLAGLFTMIFRFVPSRPVPWRAARIGGTITGLAFAIASIVIGSYFDPDRFTGTGFAGGFVLILFSVYVLAQVALFGAEIIDVHFLPESPEFEPVVPLVEGTDRPSAPADRTLPEQRTTGLGWFAAGLATGAYIVSQLRQKK